MPITHHIIGVSTNAGIGIYNITPDIAGTLEKHSIGNGFVIVSSRHTTTALAINEDEERLFEGIKKFLAKLVPKEDKYLHNDIHLRDCPPDEPENAHSHILAMLLGSSEVIPISDGRLALGKWQSVLLIELDGPRSRTVNLTAYAE